MDAAEERRTADEARRQEELANKLAHLSDEKRQKYENLVGSTIERHGSASHEYRLGLANTYAQGLPFREEGRQIEEYNRREARRAREHDQRSAHAAPAMQLEAKPTAPAPDRANAAADSRQTPRADPMAGLTPQAKDYAKLQRTHERVAAAQKQGNGQAATDPLPKEQLQDMAKRFAEERKAGNLEPTPAELRERNGLTRAQDEARQNLDRAHGAHPNAQQQRERALIEQQHLAEQLGVEGRWIAQHLRKQGRPGAEGVEQDARRAHHTARAVHEQRQNTGPDRVAEAGRISRQQDQQRQTEAQEAARGGRSSTSEQRANASPEARQALERKDRADDARTTTGPRDPTPRDGSGKPGNSRSGGRSR